MPLTPDTYRKALLAVASAYYGDQYDTDDQFMFAIACDAPRMVNADYDGKPREWGTHDNDNSLAMTMGSIMANICPGWLAGDDAARRVR